MEEPMTDFSDAPEITFCVNLSAFVTLIPYDGPITKTHLAEAVLRLIEASGVEEFIDSVSIADVATTNGQGLIAATTNITTA
jgi:hypothetical protein